MWTKSNTMVEKMTSDKSCYPFSSHFPPTLDPLEVFSSRLSSDLDFYLKYSRQGMGTWMM